MRDQTERIAASLRGLTRLVAGTLVRRQERARRRLRESTYRAQLREPVDPWLVDRVATWTAGVKPAGGFRE
jgi:hypothetical protein